MIKNFLKKFPILVRTADTAYVGWARFKAERLGIGFHDWSCDNQDAVRALWEQRRLERNYFLRDKIARFNPGSILEIGCGCGNILILVAKQYPDAVVSGIDINPVAVNFGNDRLHEEGLANVRLEVGQAELLTDIPAKSVDVIFSSAALMYVKPRHIQEVIRNMVRIARKAVVFLEMHDDCADKYLGEFYLPSNWKRNYRRIFHEIGIGDERILIESIEERLWQPGGGGGAYIEVIID